MCCFCFCFRLEATYPTGILIRLCALQPGPGSSRLLQPSAPYSTLMDSEDGCVQTLIRGRAVICCPSGCHKGCLNQSNTHTPGFSTKQDQARVSGRATRQRQAHLRPCTPLCAPHPLPNTSGRAEEAKGSAWRRKESKWRRESKLLPPAHKARPFPFHQFT